MFYYIILSTNNRDLIKFLETQKSNNIPILFPDVKPYINVPFIKK